MKNSLFSRRVAVSNELRVILLIVVFFAATACSNNRGGQYSNDLEDVIDGCRNKLSNTLDTPILISSSGHGHSGETFKTIKLYYPKHDDVFASLEMHIDADGNLTISEAEAAPHNDWMKREIQTAWTNR